MEEEGIYSESSNYSSYFDINPRTGYLILAQPIDRLPQEINKIRLIVRATDGKAETDAKVRDKEEKEESIVFSSGSNPIGSSTSLSSSLRTNQL